MTDRELMQQALEAMGTVGADWICEASHHAKKDQHKWGEPCPLQQRWHIAYQAVRERLAQPEQEQETVMAEYKFQTYAAYKTPDGEMKIGVVPDDAPLTLNGVPLYPRREWVGLTDEEIALICGECAASAHRTDDISYARAIEAKLREKNA